MVDGHEPPITAETDEDEAFDTGLMRKPLHEQQYASSHSKVGDVITGKAVGSPLKRGPKKVSGAREAGSEMHRLLYDGEKLAEMDQQKQAAELAEISGDKLGAVVLAGQHHVRASGRQAAKGFCRLVKGSLVIRMRRQVLVHERNGHCTVAQLYGCFQALGQSLLNITANL